MTEQQLKQQEQQIANQAEELARLNGIFDEQKKALGLPENEEVTFDEKEMTPELQKAFDVVKAEAEKAGKALAAQIGQPEAANPAPHVRRGVRI